MSRLSLSEELWALACYDSDDDEDYSPGSEIQSCEEQEYNSEASVSDSQASIVLR